VDERAEFVDADEHGVVFERIFAGADDHFFDFTR